MKAMIKHAHIYDVLHINFNAYKSNPQDYVKNWSDECTFKNKTENFNHV